MGYCTNLISAPPPPSPCPPVEEPCNSPGVSYSSTAGWGGWGVGDLKGNSPIYIIIIFLMVDAGKSLKKVGASQVP